MGNEEERQKGSLTPKTFLQETVRHNKALKQRFLTSYIHKVTQITDTVDRVRRRFTIIVAVFRKKSPDKQTGTGNGTSKENRTSVGIWGQCYNQFYFDFC
jgi:hypothetical protein